jgi:hypothetical protein
MRFQFPDGQIVRIDTAFNYGNVQYPSNWLRLMSVADRIAFNAVELPEPVDVQTPYVPTAADHIRNLEATVTPRRLREALLTPEGKAWLQDVEDKIAAQRTLLSPPVVEDETTKTWVTDNV